jgi:hypothetical protein
LRLIVAKMPRAGLTRFDPDSNIFVPGRHRNYGPISRDKRR